MRLAPLLALLLAVPALHAQADPNPPEAYYPLHVGDQWEYQQFADPSPFPITDPYSRSTVVRDTLAGGRRYFVVRSQAFIRQNGVLSVSEYRSAVRFDTATASVRVLQNGGTTEGTVLPCRLDLPVLVSGLAPCSGGTPPTYFVAIDTTIAIGSSPLTTSVRGFVQAGFYTTRYAAGIGYLGGEGCEIGCSDVRLVYARVGGAEYGEKIGLGHEPDLTPPRDYFPLEVGNEWIYHGTENSPYGVSDTYRRRRVLREETVDGLVYAVDQTCTNNQRDAAPGWACGTERRLRFDPVTTDIVQSIAPGVTRVLFCRLGADFGAPLPDGCDGSAYVAEPGTVRIGGIDYPVAGLKRLSTLANVPPAAFVAGIGPAETPVGAFQTSTFEFARVRGVEYGVRPAVASETGALPAEAFALAAGPNPTSGALRLSLTLPVAQTVTAEAFDALGRRVWQQTAALSAGAQTLTVDASAWAPGVYVVRVATASASASARIVRR